MSDTKHPKFLILGPTPTGIVTQLPWEAWVHREGGTFIGPCDPFAAPVVRVENDNGDADARFIVRACNIHEALCAALEDAYAHVTLLGCGEKPPLSDAEMCNLLGDALKLARGES